MKAYRGRNGKLHSFPHHSTHLLSLSGQLQAAVLHLQRDIYLFVYSSTLWHHGLVFISYFLMGWDRVHLVVRPLFGLLYQPWTIDDDDCGAIGGMRIGRGNRSTQRKPAPLSICPPQIPHDLTRDRTRAVSMGSRLLTAWAMAWPLWSSYSASSEDLHCLLADDWAGYVWEYVFSLNSPSCLSHLGTQDNYFECLSYRGFSLSFIYLENYLHATIQVKNVQHTTRK
jgi:hypothetical protein